MRDSLGLVQIAPTKFVRWNSDTLSTDGLKETWPRIVGFKGMVIAADVGTISGSPSDGETRANIEVYDLPDREGAGIMIWHAEFVEMERVQPTRPIVVERDWVFELETWNLVSGHIIQAVVAVVPLG